MTLSSLGKGDPEPHCWMTCTCLLPQVSRNILDRKWELWAWASAAQHTLPGHRKLHEAWPPTLCPGSTITVQGQLFELWDTRDSAPSMQRYGLSALLSPALGPAWPHASMLHSQGLYGQQEAGWQPDPSRALLLSFPALLASLISPAAYWASPLSPAQRLASSRAACSALLPTAHSRHWRGLPRPLQSALLQAHLGPSPDR